MGRRWQGWNDPQNWMQVFIMWTRSRQWAWSIFFCLLAFTGRDTCAQQSKELRVGHFPNLTHAQAVYGRATGQFEKAIGIPIKWTSFNAGPSAIEALFTDAIDMTFVGPNPAINGYLKSKGT